MKVTMLAVNVGNTRTEVGVFVDDELRMDERVANGDGDALERVLREAGELIRQETGESGKGIMAYAGSVNEKGAAAVEKAVKAELGVDVVRVERDMAIPIGRQLDRESIVGEDRLLNAAAAYERIEQACIVVDAGTAITVDFVDGDGTFHGGAILPGGQMMLDAMHAHTALLPGVKLDKPEEVVGHNTVQAMLGGVFYGIRGAVRELVEMYAEWYGGYPKVIATGGAAALFFEGYELVEAVVPGLTLMGLAATYRAALKAKEEGGA